MKKLIILSIAVILSAAQASAEPIRKEVPVTDVFTKIVVTSNIKLIVSDKEEVGKIVVEGQEKDVESVAVNVKKGVLSINRKGIFSPNGRVYVRINAATLRNIQARDESYVYISNSRPTDLLEVSAEEQALMSVKTNANHVVASVTDNARIKIEGKFKTKQTIVSAPDLKKTVFLK